MTEATRSLTLDQIDALTGVAHEIGAIHALTGQLKALPDGVNEGLSAMLGRWQATIDEVVDSAA